MKTLNVVVTIISVLIVIAVGYAVFTTNGTEAEVEVQAADITPAEERTTVDANILNDAVVKEVETFRTFGTQPVQPNAALLDRVNPFDNL